MNKKAKTILSYFSLAICLMISAVFLINFVIAYASGGSGLSVSYNLITSDIAGRHYTPTCLGTCDLVFSLSYFGANAPNSVAVNTNEIRAQFNWAKGQDKFQKSEIYYLNQYQEEIKDYSTVCLPYNTTDGFEGNWTYTYFSNCTQLESGSHLEKRQEWQKLTKEITLEKGKTYYIDIRGYFKINMQEGFKVDVIPLVKIATSDFMLSEMAWWNSNWLYRQCFNLTNNQNFDAINATFNRTFNVGSLVTIGKMQSDIDDLRVVDNDTNTSLNYNWTVFNSSDLNVYFKVPDNFTASDVKLICFYYGNPSAANSASDWREVYQESDDFNDNSLDTTSRWQLGTGTTQIVERLGYLHVQNSVADWIANYIGTKRTFDYPIRIDFEWRSTANKYSNIKWGFAGDVFKNMTEWRWDDLNADVTHVRNDTTYQIETAFPSPPNWNNGSLIVNATNVVIVINNTKYYYHAGTFRSLAPSFIKGVSEVWMGGYDGGNLSIDNFKVYYYMSPSPTYSEFGAEQTYDAIPPSITQINITPQQPITLDDLKCNATLTDNKATELTAYWKWYKNNQLYLSGNKTVQNGTNSLITTLLSGNLSKGQYWICEVKPFDGANYGNAANSTTVTILNTLPNQTQPKLQATSYLNTTSDNLTCYNQSTSDIDINDKVTNIYNWFKNSQPLAVLNMPFENSAKDYSGKGNNGTIYGATFTDGKIGKALSFDGIDDYVDARDINEAEGTNALTAEVWVKPGIRASGVTNPMILAKYYTWNLYINYNNNGFAFSFNDGGGWATDTVTYIASLSTDTWYYVAARYDGSTCKIFVNGNEVASASCNGNIISNANTVKIGQWNNNEWFNGTIDEVKVYPYALTSEQIKQRYEETKGGLTTSSTIVAQETTPGETYMCQVTPNDGEEDGVTLNSTDLTVLWNITFDVRSGETNASLPNFNIYCNNSFIILSTTSPTSIGFLPANYECTFVATEFYNKTITFTADVDKTINVKMSREFSLTIEEHTWLEWLYNCWKAGDCRKLLENINQTTTQIWQQVTKTNRDVVTQEKFISSSLSNTSNITLNYTVNIPFKQGYANGELLPLRLFFWFTDINKTRCYNQDKGTDSNRAESPYCFPLIAETLGPNNGSMTFTIDLRPNLPVGSYNITRTIEIDPILEGTRTWINYGQEDVGQVTVEEGNDNPSVILDKTGETSPPRTGILTGAAIQEIKSFLTENQILAMTTIISITVLIAIIVICITFYKVKKVR